MSSEEETKIVKVLRDDLLKNRDFVKFWIGETVSLASVQLTELVLLLVAVMSLHASAFEIGLLNCAQYTPYIMMSLFAGVWFDRRRRRPVLIVSNFGRAVLIGLVSFATLAGMLSIDMLYVVEFFVGVLTMLFDVGSLSYVPGLVDRCHLAEANSKIQISYSLASIGGPGLAGLLVGLLTAPIALFVNTISYLLSTLTLILIKNCEPELKVSAENSSLLALISEGLRAVFSNRILQNLATLSATFTLFENAVTTLFVVYAVRQLGLSSTQLGFVIGTGAVGALIGAMSSTKVTKLTGFGNTLRIATLVSCIAPVLFLIPKGASPVSLAILAAGLAIHEVALTVFNVNAVTLRQSITPDRLLGRMNASYRLLLFGTMPIGALFGGTIAGILGLSTGFAISVVGLVLPIAWIPFSPVFTLCAIPDSPPSNGKGYSTVSEDKDEGTSLDFSPE